MAKVKKQKIRIVGRGVYATNGTYLGSLEFDSLQGSGYVRIMGIKPGQMLLKVRCASEKMKGVSLEESLLYTF